LTVTVGRVAAFAGGSVAGTGVGDCVGVVVCVGEGVWAGEAIDTPLSINAAKDRDHVKVVGEVRV
jgi:uncharacterized membrane protein